MAKDFHSASRLTSELVDFGAIVAQLALLRSEQRETHGACSWLMTAFCNLLRGSPDSLETYCKLRCALCSIRPCIREFGCTRLSLELHFEVLFSVPMTVQVQSSRLGRAHPARLAN